MQIRLYDFRSRSLVEEVRDAQDVQVTFDTMPRQASFSVSLQEAARVGQAWAPRGEGALCEIDGTAEGVKQVYLGRVRSPQFSSTNAQVEIGTEGPDSWLTDMTVVANIQGTGTAGDVVRALAENHPGNHGFIAGVIERGRHVPIELGSSSVAELFDSLTDLTGEEVFLDPILGTGKVSLNWMHPLSGRDMTGKVLTERDCDYDLAYRFDAGLEELVTVARSFLSGDMVSGSKLIAPGGMVVGKEAALNAYLSVSRFIDTTNQAGGASLRTDLHDIEAAQAAAEQLLRASLSPVLPAQVVLNNSGLDKFYGVLRRGDLISVRWPSDFMGYYADAVARVRSVAIGISTKQMNLSVELWRVNR